MNQRKLNNKGFSLVELIIVIAIMAVLIGLLAPQFIKYVQRSKYSTDVKNGQEIATVVQTLIADNKLTQDVASPGAVFDSNSLAYKGAADSNLLSEVPTSKVSKDNNFYVTYDVKSGKVIVTIGPATGARSELYPNVGGEYATKIKE